jgi:hypothetical protein
MTMIGISQPTVFPWIGYFNMIKQSEVFILLDNVKFEKHSWQMRNRIKEISSGKESFTWLRVPTIIKKSDTLIKDVLIDNSQKWKEKHVKSLQINYGKSFNEIDFVGKIYEKKWVKLVDFNSETILECCKFLKISTKIIKASELKVEGKKSLLVLNICKEVGAKKYLAALGSKEYLEKDKKKFEDEGIEIIYHDYKHPIYKQKGTEFISNLSILDLIFNEKENSKNFI